MKRTKLIFGIMLAIIFLTTQVIAVGAAPLTQDETPPEEPTQTIVSISLETDPTNGATVVVVLSDELNTTQTTVMLSLEEAINLGLVIDDGTGNYVVDDSRIGQAIDSAESEHPVGSALSDFFYDLLGVDYEAVMAYHDDGVGFGVLAQALWMTNSLEGDSETFSAILEAKQTKYFCLIELPDGSTPTNWGQFRKAVQAAASDGEESKKNAKENLGAVMSGHADNGQDDEQTQNEPATTEETPVVEDGNNKPKNNGISIGNDKKNDDKNNKDNNNVNSNVGKGKSKGKNK